MAFAKTFQNEADIISLANEIAQAIEVTFSHTSSKLERDNAYKVFEKTRAIDPQCDKVFSLLYRKHNGFSSNIRICSLHLFDQYIKTMWIRFSKDKQLLIKEEAIKLIKEFVFEEPLSLKEAVTKVVVEIIKRTWPQYWTSLLSDLFNLEDYGPAQLELVLIIFRRLYEDINSSDEHLTALRRKEMLSTLDSSIGMLIRFFLASLNQHIGTSSKDFSCVNTRICEAALDAISAYVTWVNLEHLFLQDKLLFKSLIFLLKYDNFKYSVCNCLQVIFERKGYTHQRLDILSIIDGNLLNIIHEVARYSNEVAAQNKREYTFLKKLIETLSIFGRNHIGEVSSDKQFKAEYMDSYLKLMLQFSSHDSIMLSFAASKVWCTFLHHDMIKGNSVFVACVPDILECTFRNLSKICDPRLENSRSSFSRIDFEDIEDFTVTLPEIHHTMLDISKSVTALNPALVLHLCESKIKLATSMPPPAIISKYNLSSEEIMMTAHFISWDALGSFSKKGFAPVFFKNPKNVDNYSTASCNNMLKLLIEYRCEVPQLFIPIISAVEAFFPLFHYSQIHLLAVLNMMFGILDKPLDIPLTLKLKNVVSKSFNKLCKEIKTLLVPFFYELQVYFDLQFQKSVLTNYHKSLLLEATLFVDTFGDVALRSVLLSPVTSDDLNVMLIVKRDALENNPCKKEFIDKLFGFVHNILKRQDIASIHESPTSLLSFLGLDRSAILSEEMLSIHKEFSMTYITILSVSRTFKVCTENEIDNVVEQYSHISQYFWLQHMINCIPYLFNFSQQYCIMWSLKDQIAASKSHVFEMCDSEYSTVINKSDHGDDINQFDNNINEMQYYLYNLHEFIYTILSHLATCVGPQLYSLPGLSEALIEKLARPWAYLPNFRIRKVWKSFMKRFIVCCPSKYFLIIGPFLGISLQMMLKRLASEWERIEKIKCGWEDQLNETITSIHLKETMEDVQIKEIMDAKVMSVLTKDYIDILILFCTYKRNYKNQNIPDELMAIGKLGDFLLSYEGTSLTLIYTLFSALSWPDSTSLIKICSIVMPIIKKIFTVNGSINPEIPKQLLILLLTGLQKHGMEEQFEAALSNTIFSYYMHLRMQYPVLAEVLTQIPTCSFQQLQEFEFEVFTKALLNENKSKAKFKQLIKGACGKSMSRFYLNEHLYEELPPLARREKKENSIFDENNPVELHILFGHDDKK